MTTATFDQQADLIGKIQDLGEKERAFKALWSRYVGECSPEERWVVEMTQRVLADRGRIPRVRHQVVASKHPAAFAVLEMFDTLEGRAPRV